MPALQLLPPMPGSDARPRQIRAIVKGETTRGTDWGTMPHTGIFASLSNDEKPEGQDAGG